MSVVVGTNSWATIAEADDYLEFFVGSGNWFDLPDAPENPGDASKESFLRFAYTMLRNNPEYGLPASTTDDNVVNAQIVFAGYLVDNYEDFLDEANANYKGVSSITLSKWSESYFSSQRGSYSLPVSVATLLSEYSSDNLIVDLEVD